MEKFIPETYKEVTKNLEPVIEKYDCLLYTSDAADEL